MSTREGVPDHSPGEGQDPSAPDEPAPGREETEVSGEPGTDGRGAERPTSEASTRAGDPVSETPVLSAPPDDEPPAPGGESSSGKSPSDTGSSGSSVSGTESSTSDAGSADAPASAGTGASVAVDRGHPSGGAGTAPARRIPRFTRGVARPEGGGRAASGDAPAPARQWPMLAVLSTAGLGLLVTAFDAFRFGTILIGLALIGGAVLRWAVPSVGMLAVRSRFTDMVTYGALGTAIALLAMMAQPNPWLEIPFLGDTLHFTVK